MVSIVPLQRRTEAAAAAVAGSRSIFSLERRRREDEGRGGMDFSGTQGELAIPMHAAASPYAGAGGHVLPLQQHEHGNNNGRESPALPPSPPPAVISAAEEGSSAGKKRAAGAGAGTGAGAGGGAAAVRYRECLKNHAAAMGGNATDGCGEFMPSGEEGSLEALKCSACNCHRNFHRKEVDDDGDGCVAAAALGYGHRAGRRLLAPAMPPHHKNGGGGGLRVTAADHYAAAYPAARALPPGHPLYHHQHLVNAMPLSAAMQQASESDEMDGGGAGIGMGMGVGMGGGGGSSSSSKKRFRTKFTAEQKARMLEFAERVGWRLQKLDDAMVQDFCQEIGVRRRVLKVWMHNNKHNLATKRLEAPPMAAMASSQPPPQQQQPQMPVMPMAPPSSSQPGPSFDHGGPSSPPPPPLQMVMPMAPPPAFHRGPGSPAPIKMD